jgi:hypothetical protein
MVVNGGRLRSRKSSGESIVNKLFTSSAGNVKRGVNGTTLLVFFLSGSVDPVGSSSGALARSSAGKVCSGSLSWGLWPAALSFGEEKGMQLLRKAIQPVTNSRNPTGTLTLRLGSFST